MPIEEYMLIVKTILRLAFVLYHIKKYTNPFICIPHNQKHLILFHPSKILNRVSPKHK